MTPEGYWAAIKAFGVTPIRQVSPKSWVARDRNGAITNIPDPNQFGPEELEATLGLIRMRLGIWEN